MPENEVRWIRSRRLIVKNRPETFGQLTRARVTRIDIAHQRIQFPDIPRPVA